MMFWPALAVDAICILVFAIVGRTSHGEASDLSGVLRTAWPFLAGCLAGMLVGRVWRQPTSLAAGWVVWVGTVLVGMALRVLSGDTIQFSFVVVAAVVLGVLLVGWRAGYRLVHGARARRLKAAEPVEGP
jgi:peptidoglycan/LPS O-acetylase OafA/YrhL